MTYTQLNQWVVAGNTGYSDAWARVLSRLGDYTDIILRALNMRPAEVTILGQTSTHILVRISMAGDYFVLRIAPEGHLLCEVFFSRTMQAQHMAAPHLMYFDLKRSLVPFDYTIERYVCGSGAHSIAPDMPHMLRAVARQAGRVLRRMHRVAVPGWGHPTATGRWMIGDWQTVLAYRHEKLAPLTLAEPLFRPEEQAAVATLLDNPVLYDVQPRLMHGAVRPEAIRCTIGEHIQLEAWVDPGSIVGGDGMLDLAYGLQPAYPAEWRAGLHEGYMAVAPLTAAERERLQLLRLLVDYWEACQRYARAEPHELFQEQVQSALVQG